MESKKRWFSEIFPLEISNTDFVQVWTSGTTRRVSELITIYVIQEKARIEAYWSLLLIDWFIDSLTFRFLQTLLLMFLFPLVACLVRRSKNPNKLPSCLLQMIVREILI